VVVEETNVHPRWNGKTEIHVGALQWTEGMMIALARTNPNSPYSRETGNRWPLAYAGGLRGFDRWWFFKQAAERMQSSRHSSTHFLQHGWAPALKRLWSDPAYYAGRSRVNIRGQALINEGNSLSPDHLGQAVIELTGDSCVVMAENAVGQDGNEVLDAKHRAALIREGTPPLQQAVYKEEAAIAGKMQEYFDRDMPQLFRNV
jgi:hypothetical protein